MWSAGIAPLPSTILTWSASLPPEPGRWRACRWLTSSWSTPSETSRRFCENARAYLHGQGLVHGNLKPSHILAVEDTVKLSSDTVSAGDPAADIRALGVVLVQALRSSAIDALPFPFREAVQNCRSAGEIVVWLRSPERTARNTIHGKATVVVGVAVDASGSVAKATLEPGGSPYFGALALEAARHWQFAAVKGAGARNWTLRFEIAPAETQVIPVRAGGTF